MTNPTLSLSVTHANGTVDRWGPDEPNAEDVPNDLTFSTSIPGGFKDLTTSLLRQITVDYADLNLFDTVRAYGPGNQTAWEGRVQQFPRSHGQGFSITPGAVGWAAHLRDDPSFREIYVDRDMTRCTEATLARKVALAAAGIPQGKVPVTIGTGGIVWTPPNEALPASEITEVMYDAGPGIAVTSVGYAGTRNGTFTNFEAPYLLAANTETSLNASAALTLDGTSHFATLGTPCRYIGLRTFTTGAVTPAAGCQQSYTALAVFGSHGLAGHALASDPGMFGFYASDVVANIVTRTAPLLSLGQIDATTFAIPHLVFTDPTTGEDAILSVNAYHQYDWGVYDNKKFFYRQPDPDTLTWEARLSEGAQLELEGDTAEQVFNGVYVSYTDPTGVQRTVGPPGASADATDASLQDTSASNPVNAHGIPRRWALLNISQITTQAGAIQLGYVWLAEHSLPQRRGTLTLTGDATHPTEGKVPAWRMRAGDFVRISDHPADVPRKIIETSYTVANGGVLTATLDNTSAKLDAILERLGVSMVGYF